MESLLRIYNSLKSKINFFPMMKETKDIISEFFDDPKLNHLAFLTFAGKDDAEISFSFIIDTQTNEKNTELIGEFCQTALGKNNSDDGIALEQLDNKQFQTIDEFCFVLEQRKIKEKNQNLHKTIIRIFLNNYQMLARQKELSPDYHQFMEKIVQSIRKIGNQNIVLQHLKMLFGEGRELTAESNFQKMNRDFLHKMLSCKHIIEKQVTNSNYFKDKNKLKHLIGMKIYKIRLANLFLTGRTQSH